MILYRSRSSTRHYRLSPSCALYNAHTPDSSPIPIHSLVLWNIVVYLSTYLPDVLLHHSSSARGSNVMNMYHVVNLLLPPRQHTLLRAILRVPGARTLQRNARAWQTMLPRRTGGVV